MGENEIVVIFGKSLAIDPDDVTVVIEGTAWSGWQTVRVTRRLDAIPNDFSVELTEANGATEIGHIDAKPGDTIEVWLGKDRVLTGWLERVDSSIAAEQHTVTIAGRGATCDLVDCSAIWPGQQIVYNSVLGVAQKLAEPYGVTVRGVPGPAVGGMGTIIPTIVAPFTATCWEIIEQLCRIAGLFATEQADGSLLISPGAQPSATTRAIAAQQAIPLLGDDVRAAASGFTEGVNVESASVSMANDGRFSEYVAHRFSFDTFRDVGESQFQAVNATDPGVRRFRRHDLILETGTGMSLGNITDRVQFEASVRWGRSRIVRITTDSWRDSAGRLYEPNTTAAIEIPALKVTGVQWLISEVTYRRDDTGTHCDLELMHPLAFTKLQTLPPFSLPADVRAVGPVGRP